MTSCADQLTTPGEVAAYTRRIVAEAFTVENTTRQSDRDPTRLTMSGLGGCTRAAAYAVARTWPSDAHGPEEARQALLGTWIHEHLLPQMAQLAGLGALIEHPVRLRAAGLVIPGTLDLTHGDVVWDLKTVKEYRLHGVRRRGTYHEHWVQVFGYALGRYQAGHPVRWVVFLYLDRSTGEVHVEVEEFTNAAALAVIDRLETIRFHSADPDTAPREGRGPGLSLACDRCPWLRRCWGDDATPGQVGAQTSAAATPEGIVAALQLYATSADLVASAKRDQEFAKAVLADTPDGRYDRWTLRRGKPGSTLDQRRVADDYAARGIDMPRTETAGRMLVQPAPVQE